MQNANDLQGLTKMTVVTLKDEGQDYIKFWIEGGKITRCAPSNKEGWPRTDILNPELKKGDKLKLRLHCGFVTELEQPIQEISNERSGG